MTNRIKINGVEYPSITEGCSATGLDLNYLKVKKHRKGNKFTISKKYEIEIMEGKDGIRKTES
jgi:hypothetical protein